MKRWLFTHIDNSPLIVFRIVFGFLIAVEAFGAIFTGWIRRTMIEPQFTFNFIGFEFLQPLPGDGMYYYYALMGLAGLAVMVGYKYRWSMGLYTVMWSCVYLMQKSSYNNHYYLLMLLCLLMCILPAHRYYALDAAQQPEQRSISMPRWCLWLMIFQLWIVYTYASIAKWYPDWISTKVPENLMAARAHYLLIGDWLQQHWVHISITWIGILFDLLIIPALLWRRTRMLAFLLSIYFHIFNSIVFQIGIFPYLSLAFALFFFPAEKVNRWFLRKKPFYTANEVRIPKNASVGLSIAIVWFAIQIALPLRHWFIPGDVLWTEEGHRLSWRMMLRGRRGSTQFFIKDKTTEKREQIVMNDYLTKKQIRSVSTKPDMMWQFAQQLHRIYQEKGQDVAVYVESQVSINGKPYRQLIDPETDLASVPWLHLRTNPWVLKYEDTDANH